MWRAGSPPPKRRRGGQHHADAALGELAKIVDKAEVALALCDTRLMDELATCAQKPQNSSSR